MKERSNGFCQFCSLFSVVLLSLSYAPYLIRLGFWRLREQALVTELAKGGASEFRGLLNSSTIFWFTKSDKYGANLRRNPAL